MDEYRLAQDRLMHAALAYSHAQRDLEAAEKEWLEAGRALHAIEISLLNTAPGGVTRSGRTGTWPGVDT